MWSCTMFRGNEHGTVGGGWTVFFLTVGIVGVEDDLFVFHLFLPFFFCTALLLICPFLVLVF